MDLIEFSSRMILLAVTVLLRMLEKVVKRVAYALFRYESEADRRLRCQMMQAALDAEHAR